MGRLPRISMFCLVILGIAWLLSTREDCARPGSTDPPRGSEKPRGSGAPQLEANRVPVTGGTPLAPTLDAIPAGRRVTILDIATRAPVPGVEVLAAGTSIGAGLVGKTDALGVVTIPECDASAIALRSATWELIRPTAEDLDPGVATLYACRRLHVDVRCLSSDAALHPGTQVSVVVSRPMTSTLADHAPHAVGGEHWLQVRGVRREHFALSLDAEASFSFVTRLMPDQGLTVAGAGCWSELVRIPSDWGIEIAQPRVEVLVDLRPGYRLTGTLLDDEGAPLADRWVALIVLRRLPLEEASAARSAPQGAALNMRWGNGDATAIVETKTLAKTRSDGTFELLSAVDGAAFLFTHQPGFEPCEYRSPSVSKESAVGELRLRRTRGAPESRLVWRARGVQPGRLMVVTVSGLPQYHFDLDVEDGGRFCTEWFHRGMRYYIRYVPRKEAGPLRGEVRGVFEWIGQAELGVEALANGHIGLYEAK